MKNKNITYQKIVDAATESFQNLGYARTTTQLIANKAGVAEVTLFRHFGDKQNLFKAVFQQIGGGVNFELLEAQLNGNLEADLRLIIDHALTFFITQGETIRMMMFESSHFPEMKQALAQNPNSMIKILERYFQKQINAGVLQKIDTQSIAQSFISMIFGYAIGFYPVSDFLTTNIPIEKMKSDFVTIFLTILQSN